jgi:hypothetical protein
MRMLPETPADYAGKNARIGTTRSFTRAAWHPISPSGRYSDLGV